jgi:hypothetical protein
MCDRASLFETCLTSLAWLTSSTIGRATAWVRTTRAIGMPFLASASLGSCFRRREHEYNVEAASLALRSTWLRSTHSTSTQPLALPISFLST